MLTAAAARSPSAADQLPPVLSVYLDAVRFGAAVVVVLSHACRILFPKHLLPWPDHEAVVVFFVLSGFVIAHATNRPIDLREYAIHRVARIWSVAIPAIALSLAVRVCVGDAGFGYPAPGVASWLEVAAHAAESIVPVGEIWWNDTIPPLDGPFWSLNFEVWYYVLFGALMFLSPKKRWFAALLIAAFVGPKILIMAPIWGLGVMLYWRAPRMNEGAAVTLWATTCGLALAFILTGLNVTIRTHIAQAFPWAVVGLGGANKFVGDWLFALIIAANFAAVRNLGRIGAPLLRAERAVRAAAGCTFSAYLYHMPLLALAVLAFKFPPLASLASIAAGVYLLSLCTEQKGHVLRRVLRRGLSRAGRKTPGLVAQPL